MDTHASSRLGIAAVVAVASTAAVALILAASPASGGPAALTPDLVTLAIQQQNLVVQPDDGKTVLRLANEVGNHGNGPLEVFPGPISLDCDGDGDTTNDRDASQRTFTDSNGSGLFERGVDAIDSERQFGCMRYHPAHGHWHMLDFARYELRREPTGKLVALSRKIGFCLVDSRRAFPGPGSPEGPTYAFGAATKGCDVQATQGLSPGWADIYGFALPGQELNVSGLSRGRYCLISRADPTDLITELDEDNNVRRVRLALRPRKLIVNKLAGPCKV